MMLVDANLLIYAVNSDLPQHAAARRWLEGQLSSAASIGPGPNHWAVLRELLAATGTAGNLTTDAHIATLAIEHGAVVYSADNDFKRFTGVRHVNPLADGGR
jgi:hypothetical protein